MKTSFYHCSLVTIKRHRITKRRGKITHSSRNVCAKAAYNTGSKVTDLNTGKTYNFSSKKDVVESAIILPPGRTIPITRDELWSQVEERERRYDSRLARELRLALPHFLSKDGKWELSLVVAKWFAEFLRAPVEAALHRSIGKGKNPRNDHVHLLAPTRSFDDDGLGEKHRALDNQFKSGEQVKIIRKAMAGLINAFIAKEGFDVRVDHRSYKEQGVDKTPTKHDGPAKRAIKRKYDSEIQAAHLAWAEELNLTTFSTIAKIRQEIHEIHAQLLPLKIDSGWCPTGGKLAQKHKNSNTNPGKPKIPESIIERFDDISLWWLHKRNQLKASELACRGIDTAYVSLRHLIRSLFPSLALPMDKRKDSNRAKQKEELKLEPQIQKPPKKPGGFEMG